MNQTAIDWLVKELNLEGYDHTVEQAKQMEIDQIRHAWENGALPDILKEYKNSRTYINETYGEERV